MNTTTPPDSERGSISIFAGVAAVTLLGFSALVLDVGYMLVTNAELQNAADSGAAAGNRELGRIYEELGNVDITEYTLTMEDETRIYQRVNQFSQRNEAAGVSISVLTSDVSYGDWDKSTNTFAETRTGVNAVQVKARRDSEANGVVSTLLSHVLGRDEFGVNADAGATVLPARKLPRGKVDFPVGISRAWFEAKNSPCGGDTAITFYPTGTLQGCVGWHTFQRDPANAWALKDILHNMINNQFESPEIVAGETELIFTGGTVDSALKVAEDLYYTKRDSNGEYLVHLPVYDYDDCSNPEGWIRIVGIATAVITNIDDHGGDKRIDARIECDVLGFGEGGGPDYGTLVGLPKTTG